MSDFTSDFWSIYIIVIVVVSILACILLLWFTAKMKVGHVEPDGTNGHEWDGIREMNKPLPRWWVWMFVISIIIGIVYLIVYPGLGSYAGTFGWTSVNQLEQEVEIANKELAPLYAKFVAMKVEDLSKNKEANAIGERLFMNNCSQCHGSDANGSRSFPNLTDHDWLYGGSPEAIKTTITNGRTGMMPPMGAAIGTEEDVKNVANYVLSLSSATHNSESAQLGEEKFVICAACHGKEGKGNPAIGAPNLTDNVWLHGAGEDSIVKQINKGRVNRMPPWEKMLTSDQIHVLAAYVWGLSNNPQLDSE
ncbi:MAG: cytochrome-c oxidase, cbb3-type subunit III [Methylophilaceae bacterium]